MRREEIRLEVSNVAWLDAGGEPSQPTLTIRASADALGDQLDQSSDGSLSGTNVDVTFRFQGTADEGDARGVLAISNRVTGEFLLEANVSGTEIMGFVAAARRYAEWTDDGAHYRTRIAAGEETVVDFVKRTLLVYSNDGELLRQRSLIPSGVEI